MVPTSLNSMDPNQPASAFPSHVSDEFVVEYVGKLSMTEDLEEGSLPKNLRRHEFYELRQVPLEDICYRGEGVHEFLVKEYTQQPGDTAPPIVVDGVMMTPWDGFHRLNAARARGEETIWAYVGIRPRPDRQFFHDFPAHRDYWTAATELHGLLATMVRWRRRHMEGWVPPKFDLLMDLAARATPEYMDEQGASLLGVAVEAWADAPSPIGDLTPLVQRLLERGANPDRAFLTVRDPTTTTPFLFALRHHHPAPELVDPDPVLGEKVWGTFRDHVDLALPKNQAAVAQWFQLAPNRPLGPPSAELKGALLAARLEQRLPGADAPRAKPRF